MSAESPRRPARRARLEQDARRQAEAARACLPMLRERLRSLQGGRDAPQAVVHPAENASIAASEIRALQDMAAELDLARELQESRARLLRAPGDLGSRAACALCHLGLGNVAGAKRELVVVMESANPDWATYAANLLRAIEEWQTTR